MLNLNNKKGFTLIELLVVIAIIGILSSVVLASLSTARAKSRDARRIADIDQLRTALEVYFDSASTYPTTTATAVAQNWDANGTYAGGGSASTGISLLATGASAAIAKIPNPPSAGYKYYYCAGNVTSWTGIASCNSTSANSATAYIIGADLERNDNQALKTDADVALTTATNFTGSDTNNCINVAGGYCFDITN
jgi:type IV pilus assembly protein PilA